MKRDNENLQVVGPVPINYALYPLIGTNGYYGNNGFQITGYCGPSVVYLPPGEDE